MYGIKVPRAQLNICHLRYFQANSHTHAVIGTNHTHTHIYTDVCSLAFMAATKGASISAQMNSDEPKVNYVLIEVCV